MDPNSPPFFHFCLFWLLFQQDIVFPSICFLLCLVGVLVVLFVHIVHCFFHCVSLLLIAFLLWLLFPNKEKHQKFIFASYASPHIPFKNPYWWLWFLSETSTSWNPSWFHKHIFFFDLFFAGVVCVFVLLFVSLVVCCVVFLVLVVLSRVSVSLQIVVFGLLCCLCVQLCMFLGIYFVWGGKKRFSGNMMTSDVPRNSYTWTNLEKHSPGGSCRECGRSTIQASGASISAAPASHEWQSTCTMAINTSRENGWRPPAQCSSANVKGEFSHACFGWTWWSWKPMKAGATSATNSSWNADHA